MAGPRKKRTVRNPGAKVTRRTADIKRLWDPTKTLNQNYVRLGLAGDSNTAVEALMAKADRPVSSAANLADGAAATAAAASVHGESMIRGTAPGPTARLWRRRAHTCRSAGWRAVAVALALASAGRLTEIEALAPPEVPTQRHQSDGERQFLSKLTSKYGTNYEAMARDTKLNRYQQTAAELRRRIKRLNEAGASETA